MVLSVEDSLPSARSRGLAVHPSPKPGTEPGVGKALPTSGRSGGGRTRALTRARARTALRGWGPADPASRAAHEGRRYALQPKAGDVPRGTAAGGLEGNTAVPAMRGAAARGAALPGAVMGAQLRTDGRTDGRSGAPHGPARVPPRKRRLRVGRIGVPAPPPPASATEAPLRGSTAAALGGGAGLRLRLRPPHGPAHRAHGAAPLPFVLRAAGGRCAR